MWAKTLGISDKTSMEDLKQPLLSNAEDSDEEATLVAPPVLDKTQEESPSYQVTKSQQLQHVSQNNTTTSPYGSHQPQPSNTASPVRYPFVGSFSLVV
eukprot:m.18591 g.18591  ORF g.18591 m.18591 type:complete len:98 (+) comp27690_c0_seq1:165-458(+)